MLRRARDSLLPKVPSDSRSIADVVRFRLTRLRTLHHGLDRLSILSGWSFGVHRLNQHHRHKVKYIFEFSGFSTIRRNGRRVVAAISASGR